MYKVITSFWSKSVPNKTQLTSPSLEPPIDEDSWVFISNTDSSAMTNSWITSPPIIKSDESSIENIHQFNPIENLLIEHASMSVYDQIASKTRNRHQRKTINEQTEEEDEEEEEGDDDQCSNLVSIHQRNINQLSTINLESSLIAHHRHLYRLHQRRKRTKNLDEPKQILTKNLERQQRLRSSKNLLVQQTTSLNN